MVEFDNLFSEISGKINEAEGFKAAVNKFKRSNTAIAELNQKRLDSTNKQIQDLRTRIGEHPKINALLEAVRKANERRFGDPEGIQAIKIENNLKAFNLKEEIKFDLGLTDTQKFKQINFFGDGNRTSLPNVLKQKAGTSAIITEFEKRSIQTEKKPGVINVNKPIIQSAPGGKILQEEKSLDLKKIAAAAVIVGAAI